MPRPGLLSLSDVAPIVGRAFAAILALLGGGASVSNSEPTVSAKTAPRLPAVFRRLLNSAERRNNNKGDDNDDDQDGS